MYTRLDQEKYNIGNLRTSVEIDGNSEQTLIIAGSVNLHRFQTLTTFIKSATDGRYTIRQGSTMSVVVIGEYTTI